MLFSHIFSNTFSSVIIIVVFYMVFKDDFTTTIQNYWMIAILGLLSIRLYFYAKFLKGEIVSKPKKWLLYYAIFMFLLGSLWACLILIPIGNVDNQILIMAISVILLTFASVSSISSSAHPFIIWPFLVPIGFVTSYVLNGLASNQYSFVVSVGPLIFCGVTGYVSHKIHNTIINALYLEAKNNDLMDEVVEIAKKNQKSYESFQVLLDNLGAGAAMFDGNFKVLSWNKSFENIFNMPSGLIKPGMSLKEMIRKIIKQSWQDKIDINHAADAHIKELLAETNEETNEENMVKLILADGRNLYSRVVRINEDQIILNYTDVTSLEKERAEDVIHVLQHDNLTGLPNKVRHKKEVRKRVSEFAKMTDIQDENEHFMGLIHFGLNSLNEIYEFLGLNAGDLVVAEIASRCKKYLGDDAHLSHVEYDEFHIITEQEENLEQVLTLVEKLVEVISEPIIISGNSVTMTVSVGISTYPDHAEQAEILDRNAKIAFNKAKLPTEENIIVYNHGMHSQIIERSNLLFDIRESINKSEFLLHYQPQIDIKSRKICGVEALLRWHHPDKGWISPDDFIPLAEHTKQIIPLTEQFLPEACHQAKRWQNMGVSPIRMSVNISPFHFHEKGFTKFIQNCFEGADLDPEFLDLEITEGVIMSQTEEIINILHELSEMGVQLSIDDFGTGYSSLSYLRRLPVDKLKIDQTFIKDMSNDESAMSLVEAIIRLGHSFNLDVIAEGVETEEQLNKLFALNCDQAQGFFVKRPEKADDISTWIKDNLS